MSTTSTNGKLDQIGRSAGLRVVERVLALHQRGLDPIYDFECVEGDCEHPTSPDESSSGWFSEPGCPPLAEAACVHCSDLNGPREDGWEHEVPPAAFWPCSTVRALLGEPGVTELLLAIERAAKVARSAQCDQVLAAVREAGAPGLSLPDLIRATALDAEAVRHHLSRLASAHHVVCDLEGRWHQLYVELPLT